MRQNECVANEYKKCSNKVKDLGKKLKKQYYDRRMERAERNNRETWKVVNEIINKRQSNSPPVILNVDDKVLSDPIEVANAMNEYFVTAAASTYNTRNLCKITTEPTTEFVKTFEPASQTRRSEPKEESAASQELATHAGR